MSTLTMQKSHSLTRMMPTNKLIFWVPALFMALMTVMYVHNKWDGDSENKTPQTHGQPVAVKDLPVPPQDADIKQEMSETGKLTFHGLSDAKVTLKMGLAEAENNLYEYIEHIDLTCKESRRFGKVEDGGWDWCLHGPYAPVKDKCLVYSFGIGTEWSFDDAIANPKEYGCIDRAFDPTNGKKDHIRGERIHFYSRGVSGSDKVDQLIAYNIAHKAMTLNTFASFREEFNDTETPLDYFKMDVEYSEWDAFRTILYNGDLNNVKQVGIEIHTNEVFAKKDSSIEQFKMYYDVLKGLEDAGFMKWHTHANMAAHYKSKQTNKIRTCCYEMKYINIKLLTGNFDTPQQIAPYVVEYNWDGLSEEGCEKQFDRSIHDIHLVCPTVKVLDIKTTKEKIKVCDTNLNQDICSYVSVRNDNIAEMKKEVLSKLGCSYIKIDSKNGQINEAFSKELQQLKGSSVLEVALNLQTWNVLETLITSYDLTHIKQLILTVSTKEYEKGSVSKCSDFTRYYNVLNKIEKLGFKKWLVRNSQKGMYDSSRTGNRLTHTFRLHYQKV